MKNKYNPLYDPHGCNCTCISGQLFLTDIIEKLEDGVEGFKLIQSNTDGLMIKYPVKHEKKLNEIVEAFERRTRLNFEYTEIHRIAQKDVNNYIVEVGATYLIKDGVKTFTKPDKHKINTKGGWVSLWQGGSFKNNSLVIVAKAIVDYFMNGIEPEETINNATDIFDFQMVCKTGRTFSKTVWEVKGKLVEVQRVNRVYAVSDASYGVIYKMKGDSKNKLPDIPEHCYVDNENNLTIDQIDRQFYINLAKKRIEDYKGSEEPKPKKRKVKEKMVAAKQTAKLTLFQKITQARLSFLEANVAKGGANHSVGYEYFELNNIVPEATKIFGELGLFFQTTFVDGIAIGRMYDAEDVTIPPVEFSFKTEKMTPIISKSGKVVQTEPQVVGAEITYYRRYLYMLAMDICEHDKIENLNKPAPDDGEKLIDKMVEAVKEEPKKTAPATPEQRSEAVKEMTNTSITPMQIKAVKKALQALRDTNKDANYELFINDTVKAIKGSMTSVEAEDLLIKIGDMIQAEKEKVKANEAKGN